MRQTIEWAIRCTVLPWNFAVISRTADFVRSSIVLSGGICTVSMSDFGTPASSRNASSTVAQLPLKAGISPKPWMRTIGWLIWRAVHVYLGKILNRVSKRSALIVCIEQVKVLSEVYRAGWDD